MTADTHNGEQYLTFSMDGERFALPVENIREALLVPKITKIPQMPEYMRGVINLRGSVVPLIDLRHKFGMGETDRTAKTSIIVIEIPSGSDDGEKDFHYIGLYVDAVDKVVTIRHDEIEPPPKIGSKINTSFILGLGHITGEFVVILNIGQILTIQDLETIEAV